MIYGVVIAGGRSSRMGQNKALLEHPMGDSLFWEVAHAKLASVCDLVGVSLAGDEHGLIDALAMRSIPVHADQSAELGPVSALLSGLSAAESAGAESALFLPVDLPLLPVDWLARLAREVSPSGACVGAGYSLPIQPLLANLPVSAKSVLQREFSSGKRSARAILAALGAKQLGPQAFSADQDQWQSALFNVNTPEEYQHARELWRKQDSG